MTPRQHNELQRQADVIERNKEYKTIATMKQHIKEAVLAALILTSITVFLATTVIAIYKFFGY
jgi:multisubunit Na+/H+ antiporter MnhC subunit